MAKKTKAKSPTNADLDAQQPALVPMTEDELKAAGHSLRDLGDMKREHADERADRKAERDKLEAEIDAIAGTIRSQGR